VRCGFRSILVSLQISRVWVLHVATKPKMGFLWISKVPFYWQIEKLVGRNGRKSCNEKVSKNTLFVAGFLSGFNALDKLYTFSRSNPGCSKNRPHLIWLRISGYRGRNTQRRWKIAVLMGNPRVSTQRRVNSRVGGMVAVILELWGAATNARGLTHFLRGRRGNQKRRGVDSF
jgi:hypothetical protein